MLIALLQINTTAGDTEGNAALIMRGVRDAQCRGAHLIITPELALMGYLPRDLLMNSGFIAHTYERAKRMAQDLASAPPVLVGAATENSGPNGRPLFNSALLLSGGKIQQAFHKTLLPTYDVFDEDRYFEPARGQQILEINSKRIGISFCEDVWNDAEFWPRRRYQHDPVATLAESRIEAIVNLSASPFTVGKHATRERMLAHIAQKHRLPLMYVNQVGGNDDLVFDGRSCAFSASGKLIARGAGFTEDIVLVDLDGDQGVLSADDFEPEAETWNALVLGTRDYARKTGFSRVVLGLSGGIDSALTAAIAVEAVGKEQVLGVLMPSPYSSQGSIDDAEELARNLGIETLVLPITRAMESYAEVLRTPFAGYPVDVTEENIQARIRGNLLMALSNKFGSLVLATGNKSELSVGYCTIYGDMSGGLSVIADVPKTMVYRMAQWRNKRKPNIPEAILTKAPSAELRPNQTDQQSLPRYDLLDAILEKHVEQCLSADDIIAEGYNSEMVHLVLQMVAKGKFKRKQAAPGLKVTSRAFGTGWRMPISRGVAA
jgi:NAD+ synthase/NAD+ synthase (glutamine-hydrolysing)